jgi:hypothetical protein
MRRQLLALTLSVGCAVALNAAAPQKEKVKIDTEHGKTVTYSGCVQTGSEARTFVLEHAVPKSKTETTEVGTAGNGDTVTTTTTTTRYMLVPESSVHLQENVGHKVQVTGVLIPAGKGETKYRAKTETKGGEETIKGEVERGPVPQLRVISVRPSVESCS